MTPTPIFALLGTFVGSSFALIRFALTQTRALIEGHMQYLEHVADREERSHQQLAAALDGLSRGVEENAILLRRLTEWLEVPSSA